MNSQGFTMSSTIGEILQRLRDRRAEIVGQMDDLIVSRRYAENDLFMCQFQELGDELRENGESIMDTLRIISRLEIPHEEEQ